MFPRLDSLPPLNVDGERHSRTPDHMPAAYELALELHAAGRQA